MKQRTKRVIGALGVTAAVIGFVLWIAFIAVSFNEKQKLKRYEAVPVSSDYVFWLKGDDYYPYNRNRAVAGGQGIGLYGLFDSNAATGSSYTGYYDGGFYKSYGSDLMRADLSLRENSAETVARFDAAVLLLGVASGRAFLRSADGTLIVYDLAARRKVAVRELGETSRMQFLGGTCVWETTDGAVYLLIDADGACRVRMILGEGNGWVERAVGDVISLRVSRETVERLFVSARTGETVDEQTFLAAIEASERPSEARLYDLKCTDGAVTVTRRRDGTKQTLKLRKLAKKNMDFKKIRSEEKSLRVAAAGKDILFLLGAHCFRYDFDSRTLEYLSDCVGYVYSSSRYGRKEVRPCHSFTLIDRANPLAVYEVDDGNLIDSKKSF